MRIQAVGPYMAILTAFDQYSDVSLSFIPRHHCPRERRVDPACARPNHVGIKDEQGRETGAAAVLREVHTWSRRELHRVLRYPTLQFRSLLAAKHLTWR